MATIASPILTWTGSTRPQQCAVVVTNTNINDPSKESFPVYTRDLLAAPSMTDWGAGGGGGTHSYPIG